MQRKLITKDDLINIACGATILGSGGGGDPAQELMLAQYITEVYGPAELIDLNEIDDNALVVPVGFMGSPQVIMEVASNGMEFDAIFDRIEQHFQRKIEAVVAAEIGGANGLVPIIVGSKKKLPVVDGDTLGRAFPELHMSSCALFDIPCAPCFIADSLGNVTILHEKTPKEVEKKGRVVCAEMGSNAAVCVYIMTGKQAKQALIPGTMTHAQSLGSCAAAKDLTTLKEQYDLKVLCKGVIVDIVSQNDRGFMEGKVVIQLENGVVDILFQNEYLIARNKNHILAITPDIICLFEENQFIPLVTENLRYGMHVFAAALPSPALWKTEKGLAIVGPQAFGY